MRKITFSVFVLLILGAAQAAIPIAHRHEQTKRASAGDERWRNSNAFAVRADVPSVSEGAMTSGLAGH